MRRPKILLIDDEVAFVLNVAEMLKMIGYEVTMAFSGRQGLMELEENAHDVVVLDLRMPGISGVEVLKIIRPELTTSPEVIILTGFGNLESSLESLHNGAFDYLKKPIKIYDLVESIKNAYQQRLMKISKNELTCLDS